MNNERVRTDCYGPADRDTFHAPSRTVAAGDRYRAEWTDTNSVLHVSTFTITTPAAATKPAVRGDAPFSTVGSPVPPSTLAEQSPGTPHPGDCLGWQSVFVHHGATAAELDFFFGRTGGINVINRETRCGIDTLNESSGDSGICQINPVHNRPGYFGGREFGRPGGWLSALHGLTTRTNTTDTAWSEACLTLYRVCGTRPWQPPYGCVNNRLPT